MVLSLSEWSNPGRVVVCLHISQVSRVALLLCFFNTDSSDVKSGLINVQGRANIVLQMFEIYEDIGMKDPQPLVENLLRIFDKWELWRQTFQPCYRFTSEIDFSDNHFKESYFV